jgi:replicative DNA helicase
MTGWFIAVETKLNDSSAALKATAGVFCRFDKLDALFAGFIVFALIIEALRFSVNRP